MKNFGGYISEVRRGKRITLRSLAKMAGISPGYLSEIENGRKFPPRDEETLLRIASSLHIDPDVLRDMAFRDRSIGKVKDFLSTLLGGDGDLAYSLYRATDGKNDAKLQKLKDRITQTIHDWEEEESND